MNSTPVRPSALKGANAVKNSNPQVDPLMGSPVQTQPAKLARVDDTGMAVETGGLSGGGSIKNQDRIDDVPAWCGGVAAGSVETVGLEENGEESGRDGAVFAGSGG